MRLSDDAKARLHRLGITSIVDILASTEGGPYAMVVSTSDVDLPVQFRLTNDAVVLDDAGIDITDRAGAIGLLADPGLLTERVSEREPDKTREGYPFVN